MDIKKMLCCVVSKTIKPIDQPKETLSFTKVFYNKFKCTVIKFYKFLVILVFEC